MAAPDRALRLVWIACGKDDRLVENGQRFADLLKDKGIRNEFHITEGNHSWPVWRRCSRFGERVLNRAGCETFTDSHCRCCSVWSQTYLTRRAPSASFWCCTPATMPPEPFRGAPISLVIWS